MKVLVVDDSSTMRRIFARVLANVEGTEVEVLEAADGMEALAVVERHGRSIDLILCDVNMPNVNGLALLKSLRASPEFKRIPFVIVTADVTDESAAQALREGAADLIGKPFQARTIVDLVRSRDSSARRTTPAVFKTDAIARMIRTMTRSGRTAAP